MVVSSMSLSFVSRKDFLFVSIFILVPFCSLQFAMYMSLFLSLLLHRIHNSISICGNIYHRIVNMVKLKKFNWSQTFSSMPKYSPFFNLKKTSSDFVRYTISIKEKQDGSEKTCFSSRLTDRSVCAG